MQTRILQRRAGQQLGGQNQQVSKISISLHSNVCSNLPTTGFYCEKMVEELRKSRIGGAPITVGKSERPLRGESWSGFHFLKNLNREIAFIQTKFLGVTPMPPFSFLFPLNQIRHQFLSLYLLNISHLYITFQVSSLSPA